MELTEDQVEMFLTEDVGEIDEEVMLYLIESRVDFIKNQHKDKITTEHDPEAADKTSDQIIDHISEKIDPTEKKEHTNWLTNRYRAGEFKLSDSRQMKKLMNQFVDTKKYLENQDVNGYKSVDHLKDAVVASSAAKDVANKVASENTVHDMKEIYNDSGVTGYKIPNKATSIRNYGPAGKITQTNWCTSSPSGNYFNEYRGGKYTMHIPDKEGKIHVMQLNHESGQIMDKTDSRVDFAKSPFNENLEHIHKFALKTADLEGLSATKVTEKTKEGLEYFGRKELPPIKPLLDEHLSNVESIKELASMGIGHDGSLAAKHNSTYYPLIDGLSKHHIDTEDFSKLMNLKEFNYAFGQHGNVYSRENDRSILNKILSNRKLPVEVLDNIVTNHQDKFINNAHTNKLIHSHDNLSDDSKHKLISSIISRGDSFMASNFLASVKNLNKDHILRLLNSRLSINDHSFNENKLDLPREVFEGSEYLYGHKDVPHDMVEKKLASVNDGKFEIPLTDIRENKHLPSKYRIAAMEKLGTKNIPSDSTMIDILSKSNDDEKNRLLQIRLNEPDLVAQSYPLFDTSVHLTKDHVKKLLGDQRIVKNINSQTQNVLHNPRVQHKEISELLSNSNTTDVQKSAILATGKTKEQNITQLLSTPQSDKLATEMLDNQNTVPLSPKHIEHFLNPDNKYHDVVRFKAIKHPSVRLSHFESVKNNPKFHGLITRLKNAPPTILHSLSSSPMDHVRSNIAANPNTQRKTLEILRHDPVEDVAETAQKKLSKLK